MSLPELTRRARSTEGAIVTTPSPVIAAFQNFHFQKCFFGLSRSLWLDPDPCPPRSLSRGGLAKSLSRGELGQILDKIGQILVQTKGDCPGDQSVLETLDVWKVKKSDDFHFLQKKLFGVPRYRIFRKVIQKLTFWKCGSEKNRSTFLLFSVR